MKQPHKHAELIKAWADGAEIQVRSSKKEHDPQWINTERPSWDDTLEYRIKPEPTDFDIHDVEVGDIWRVLPSDTVITVRYVRKADVMGLDGLDYGNKSLSLLLFRRGVVDKL